MRIINNRFKLLQKLKKVKNKNTVVNSEKLVAFHSEMKKNVSKSKFKALGITFGDMIDILVIMEKFEH